MKQTTTMAMRLWAVLLLAHLSFGMAAQVESQLSYRRYTTQDGLPQMQTERIFQDARGYIYVGTLSGFVRFDGRTMTPFLRGHRWNVVGFAETSEGVSALSFRQQWLMDGDELALRPIDPQGQWLLNNFNATDLPNGYVLLEDKDERNRRLCHMTPDGFDILSQDTALDTMTPDRHLYIDTIKGMMIPQGNIYGYHRQGSTLYAFAQDGIYTVEGDSVVMRTPFDKWSPDYGLLVRKAEDGTLLIADSHSVYSYDGKSVTKLAGGFNLIRDLFVDRWNRLWLATYQGLYCFFGRQFTNWQLTDKDDIVRAVAVNPYRPLAGQDAGPVMGTLNGKILCGGQVLYDNPEDFFQPSAAVIDSCVYLAGSSDVARVADGKVSWLGLPFSRYQFVAEANGNLVLGLRQLIAAYHPATGRIDTLSTEISHPWCAAADGDGNLWVGSTYGLYRLSPDRGSRQPVCPTEQVGFRNQHLIVSTMDADSRGTVFFASVDSLFMIRQGEVVELSSQLPLLSGHEVRAVHVSPRGYLVVAAIDGLLLCRITDDYQLADARFYDHRNGFTMIEPLKALMAEDGDGTVWLPGIEEMTSFRPAELLSYNETDTYIAPPLKWWQHWWVWIAGVLAVALVVWMLTRYYDRLRHRREMVSVEGQKLRKEQQIKAIREKVTPEAECNPLARDILKMTERAESSRMTISTAGGTVVIDAAEIAYFKANGNYTRMVSFAHTDTLQVGIGKLEKMLDPKVFIRADRSTLVNLHNISRLNPNEHRCIFRSDNGVEVETTLLTPAFSRLQSLM